MQHNIQNYMEYVFSLALQKCQNFADAEDLSQETLLAMHLFISKGGKIDNIKAWLSGTLNHKYYDLLRKKYKMPLISIDSIPEPACTEEDEESKRDLEQMRREIAFLSKRYREVIVRHYLYGQKVNQIAQELEIPKGTVLSRLASGREQIKKGMENMKNYDTQSYTPEYLDISLHGTPGLHGEPQSIVESDLMKQNILIAAYDLPASPDEIARTLGIPAPYVEKAVDCLIKSQLMCPAGRKVFTDFMITRPQDELKILEREIQFAQSNYKPIWDIISEGISSLNKLGWVQLLDEQKQSNLAYYYILHIFATGIYTALKQIMPDSEIFPQRPDGGSWIAVGHRYPENFDWASYKKREYSFGGERRAYWENFLSAKSIHLHVYDTQPNLNKYERGPVEIHDDNLSKLLYIIYKGIPFEAIGFNALFLEDIPHLAECGILRIQNGQPCPAVPIISKAQYEEMDGLRLQYAQKLAAWLDAPMRGTLPECKYEIPRHLEGRIAKFRQYQFYDIVMAVIKEAAARGDFLKNTDSPAPMVLVADQD